MLLPLMPVVAASLISRDVYGAGDSLRRPCRTLVAVTADTIVDRTGARDNPLAGC